MIEIFTHEEFLEELHKIGMRLDFKNTETYLNRIEKLGWIPAQVVILDGSLYDKEIRKIDQWLENYKSKGRIEKYFTHQIEFEYEEDFIVFMMACA